MSTELGNINDTVNDPGGLPLKGAAVTLLGASSPQFQVTESDGKCAPSLV